MGGGEGEEYKPYNPKPSVWHRMIGLCPFGLLRNMSRIGEQTRGPLELHIIDLCSSGYKPEQSAHMQHRIGTTST